jgi:hypothetical protein
MEQPIEMSVVKLNTIKEEKPNLLSFETPVKRKILSRPPQLRHSD